MVYQALRPFLDEAHVIIAVEPAPHEQLVKNSQSEAISKEDALIDLISKTRVTERTHIKPLIPVVTVSNCTFGRTGDFCVVAGQRKSGKTTVNHFVIATALMPAIPPDLDTLGVRSTYAQGKPIVVLDTEGSTEDTKDLLDSVKRIAGLESDPDNLIIYNWREFSQKECRDYMEIIFKLHPDPHLIIIDGIADLVSKLNDEQESNETVRWIMRSAARLNTCFVLVIHENPKLKGQDAKLRGHFGSELERKASAAITIEKDKESGDHFILSRFLRKSADFEPIAFRWDKELGRPVSRAVSPAERELAKNGKLLRRVELTNLRNRCFYQIEQLSEDDFKAKLKVYQPASPTKDAERQKAGRNITKMLEDDLIESFVLAEKTYYKPILSTDSVSAISNELPEVH